MKITRVYFKCFDSLFAIDRPYNDEMDEQKNCDDALQTMVNSMGKSTIVPAIELHGQDKNMKGTPVFMNLGMLPFVSITNIGVYETKEPQQKNLELVK